MHHESEFFGLFLSVENCTIFRASGASPPGPHQGSSLDPLGLTAPPYPQLKFLKPGNQLNFRLDPPLNSSGSFVTDCSNFLATRTEQPFSMHKITEIVL